MGIPVGVVLYNPEIGRLRENLSSVCEEAQEIIVVDNASENSTEISELLNTYSNVVYVRNGRNLGIAKALNQICEAARAHHYAFVVTLDQDSVCPGNMMGEYRKYAGLSRMGILCPRVMDRGGGLLEPDADADGNISAVSRCITSASLVSLEAWEAVCGFDETMFIDGVDHDFCERIAQKGYLAYRVNSVTLLHEIGSIEVRRFLAWRVIVKNHPPFRKYYIARNTIFLARKRKSAGAVFQSYLRVAKQFLVVLFYENGKKEKLGAILRGVSDGWDLGIDKRWG